MSRGFRKLSKVIKGSSSSSNNDNGDAESITTNSESRRNSSGHLSSVSASEYPLFNSNYTQGDRLSSNKNNDEKKSIKQSGIPEQTRRKNSSNSSTSPSTSRQASTSVNGNNHNIQPTTSNSSLFSVPRNKTFSNTITNSNDKLNSYDNNNINSNSSFTADSRKSSINAINPRSSNKSSVSSTSSYVDPLSSKHPSKQKKKFRRSTSLLNRLIPSATRSESFPSLRSPTSLSFSGTPKDSRKSDPTNNSIHISSNLNMDPLTRSVSNGSTDTTDTTRTNTNKGSQTYNKDFNRKQNNTTANNSLKLEVPLPSPKIVEIKNTFDPNFDLKNGSNSYENNTKPKSASINQSKNETLNGQETGSNNNITNDRSKSQATTESLLKNPFGIDLELDDNTISQIVIDHPQNKKTSNSSSVVDPMKRNSEDNLDHLGDFSAIHNNTDNNESKNGSNNINNSATNNNGNANSLSQRGSASNTKSQSTVGASWAAPESWKVKVKEEQKVNNSISQSKPSMVVDSSSSSSECETCSTSSFEDGDNNIEELDDNAETKKTKSGTLLNDPATVQTVNSSTSPDNKTGLSASKPKSASVVSNGTERHHHHHFHHHHTTLYHQKELKGASKSSVRVFKDTNSKVLPCTLDTTCQDLIDSLRRRRFLKIEEDHILVLQSGGLIRTLSMDEKPLKIQRNLLFVYGYTERDNLDFIERTDLSFLFKFVVQDRGVELISNERRRMINPQNVNLKNWNLHDIPNFLYAEPILDLDVSQNPSFEFTDEFMHDCRNLLSLTFARSGNPYFPNPVVNAPRLVKLDLEVNYIKIIPSQISMLKTLTTLNLACNRISSLPESFGSLQNLTNINLSSNRIKTIPSSITKIRGLKRLDLSYNSIVSLPYSISELDKLEVLQLSANFLSKELPDFVSKMQALIKIDIRFNKITKLDSLKELPKLEVIRAAGNSVSTFISKASNLFEVELNMNPLTFVNFECAMPNLKIVDFSKGKLTSCDFVSSLTNVEKLTLDNNHLVSLSNNISKMKNLVHLSVIKNNITALPDCIGSLTKLKTLDLHLNNISVLNPDIWMLSNLESLNVSSNLLQNFPEPPEALLKNFLSRKSKLQHQKQLQDQIIENAKLKNKQTAIDTDEEDEAAEYEELNADIGDNAESPKNLKDLAINVSDSKQKKSSISPPLSPSTAVTQTSMSINDSLTGTLSDEKQKTVFSNIRRRGSEIDPHQQLYIGLEKSLKYLSMADNKLNDGVIQIISRFQNLEILNISYNDLFDIPSGHLSNLKKLKSLYLSGNHLSSLPVEDFDAFTEVTSLNLNGNRFQTLPAEIYKIKNLTALDVGSNSLKYNIANIPYDWNWCYNPNLKYLNFSGNKRLEIKPQHKREGMTDSLDSFLTLKNLKLLGLMDVTITTDAVPEQTVDTRVRTTASQLGSFGYGISDTLGDRLNLTTRDVVIEKFRGNPDETLLTIYDGKNCSDVAGDKISKIIQETFGIHLTKELQDVEEPSEGYSGKTVVDALRGAFLTMNSEMNILINKGQSSTFSYTAAHRTTTTDELSLEEDGHTGCCSTVIYIKGDDLYIANIGDVMGLLTKSDGEYKILTTKHEPYAPEEYERIRASGGYVTTDGYLDGVSEVSRAAGFFKLIPHINAAPSISHVKLSQNEEMIAIATSEIWKKVPHDLIADIVRQEKSNPGIAAEKLRDFAISYGVNEKITAVVLSLRQFSSKQKTHDRSSQAEDSTLRKLDEEIDPPIGDVAMVFTDIKNSTLLWDNYPEAMRSAIKVHNAIMRRQLRIIGGYEVKTEGDAFMVSFPTVTSALLWCFTVQSQLLATPEWPTEILASDQGYEIKDDKGNLIFKGLSVRMGIHWGTPVCERDVVTKRMDYFGPMVNRASRVSAVADGGQITMSTDLYSEFKKILGYHQAYNEKKQSLEEIYGGKALGQTIEKQLDQLEQVGWVEKSIGARKLKGLEAPETIWLIYPKPLASRLKMIADNDNGHVDNKIRKFEAGGITNESAWRLRLVSLRLERICSFYTGSAGILSTEKETGFSKSSNQKQNFFAFKEKDVLEFMDHLITRIENCVAVLILRQKVGKTFDGLAVGNIGELMDEFLSLLSLVDKMKSGNLHNTAIASNERQQLLIEEIPNETTSWSE